MKIISLSSSIAGPACAIACSIKKHFYNNNYETNMFDFLEVSLESIIKVLSISNNNLNIDDYLNNNYDIIVNSDGNNSVFFNNFDKLISHHDLILNYNKEIFNIFIEKYKRRYNRFINHILNEDKIFFIRFGEDNKDSIISFINNVKKINNNLKVYYINLYFDENNKKLNNDIKNYYYINFYNTIDLNKIYSEDLFHKTMEFNWIPIFEIINNNLDKAEKITFY
jgi:hypothetical protein